MATDLLPPAPAATAVAAPAGAAVPVFLDLNQRRVLLVGGGPEALAQLTTVLTEHPTACVTVVAPRLLPELAALTQRHPQVQVLRRTFEPTDLAGHDLV
ncbi:MAG: NAD(P)-dependent oxidoreductase, partial [Cytophagaceae bacterium]